jgi:hypothetical protein
MSEHDPFRPQFEPARAIYDAFQIEGRKRSGSGLNEWVCAERNAVWRSARDFAQQRGLSVPTIEQVEKEEVLAMGHVDYGSKWAVGVAELLVSAGRATATSQLESDRKVERKLNHES